MAPRYHVEISKRASSDLRRIFSSIAAASAQNATNVVRRIVSASDLLKHVPHRSIVDGQREGEVHPVRSLPVQSWVIFFEVLEEHRLVRILRVRHGSQRRLKRYR